MNRGYDFGWGGMLLMSLGTVLWIALMVVLLIISGVIVINRR